MTILQEAFQSSSSRKAFFAKLRKAMGVYPKGKFSASEYLDKSGKVFQGYEEKGKSGGRVLDAGPIKGVKDPSRLVKLLSRVRNVKNAEGTTKGGDKSTMAKVSKSKTPVSGKRSIKFDYGSGHTTGFGTAIQLEKAPFKLSKDQVDDLKTPGSSLRKQIASSIKAARKAGFSKMAEEQKKFKQMEFTPESRFARGEAKVGKVKSSWQKFFGKGVKDLANRPFVRISS